MEDGTIKAELKGTRANGSTFMILKVVGFYTLLPAAVK